MTIEEEILIEKVIWLIEDSYPDTDEWGHDTLVDNITESLETRADELNRMFGDSEIPTNPWHKASEELPKEDVHILTATRTQYGYAYEALWYPEPPETEEMDWWMEIPEIKEV